MESAAQAERVRPRRDSPVRPVAYPDAIEPRGLDPARTDSHLVRVKGDPSGPGERKVGTESHAGDLPAGSERVQRRGKAAVWLICR